MKIGVPRETYPGERRVALVPAVIPSLLKAGFEVVVEAGAGHEAAFPDADYIAKGARILPTRAEVFDAADIIVQVLCHGSNDVTGKDDLPLMRPDHVLIGFLRPLGIDRDDPRGRGPGSDVVFRRAHAADNPRAKYGRAHVDGDDRRLQGRRDRCRQAAAHCFRC